MTYDEETKTFTIETEEEAAVFTIRNIDMLRNGELAVPYRYGTRDEISGEKVLAAITPSEGDAVFWWFDLSVDDTCNTPDDHTPMYWIAPDELTPRDNVRVVKANALTIGKDVGALRELLRQARGGV